MGWFWANTESTPPPMVAPHPMPANTDAVPPPSCPMHKPQTKEPVCNTDTPKQACPYTPPEKSSSPPSSSTPSYRSETISKLNPLNWMPTNLSNKPAENQTAPLPLEREISTIPKGDGPGNWEYPSPQQMYNALLRKGYSEGSDGIEPMVAVHNFLNEGTWAEIMEWERRFSKGVVHGWQQSLRGEAGTVHTANGEAQWLDRDIPEPQLSRFMGRPGQLSPKARMMQVAGWAFPSKFNSEPPFDRHDWFVKRTLPNGTTKDIRYVIDYYSGPPEDDGMPVFFLDVRPAVDSPSAAAARLIRWGGDVWYRGTGAEAREEMRAQQARVS